MKSLVKNLAKVMYVSMCDICGSMCGFMTTKMI